MDINQKIFEYHADQKSILSVTKDLFCAEQKINARENPNIALKLAIHGDKRQKLHFFRHRVILFSAFSQAFETAKFLIKQAEFLDEPGGLMILAEGGCGKSFIGEQLIIDFPRVESVYDLKVSVVFADLRADPDEKSFMAGLLEQLGEVINKNLFTANELEEKLIIALKRVKCRCIFIDEAQRLDTITKNRRQADRKMGAIGERLKAIYRHAKVAIILAGTPSLEELVLSDPQYRTRWSASVRLTKFSLDAEFQGVLNALAASIPLKGQTDFSQLEVASAILTSCDGYFRLLKNFLCNALSLAIDSGALSITLKHLQQAYLLTSNYNKTNPFEALVNKC